MQPRNAPIYAGLLLAAPCVALGQSLTEDIGYAGLQLSSVTFSPDFTGEDANIEAAVTRAGYHVNPYFSAEGRFGFGYGDDSIHGVDVELEHVFGGYGRAHLPMGNMGSFYAIAGYTYGEGTAKTDFTREEDSDSGFSYGVGFDIYPNDSFGINVEYMQYLDESNYDIDAISIGVVGFF